MNYKSATSGSEENAEEMTNKDFAHSMVPEILSIRASQADIIALGPTRHTTDNVPSTRVIDKSCCLHGSLIVKCQSDRRSFNTISSYLYAIG